MSRLTAALTASLAFLAVTVPAAVQTGKQETAGQAFPTLSSGPLAAASVTKLPSGVLLQSGDLKLTQKDLDSEIRRWPQEFWPQLKRNLFFVLESLATQSMLAAEARQWAKAEGGPAGDDNSVMEAYLQSLGTETTATEAETREFFDHNKPLIRTAGYDDIKEQLRDAVIKQKREELVRARINTLGERYEVRIDRDWTAKQNAAAVQNPVDKARLSGLPTFVEFGSDTCRPCQMMKPILADLRKVHAGKLNVVVVDASEEQMLGARYGVEAIPVQLVYDKSGKEVFHHVGYLARAKIDAVLAGIGVR